MSATPGTRWRPPAEVTKRTQLISSDMNGTLNHAPNSPNVRPTVRACVSGYVVSPASDKGPLRSPGQRARLKYNNPIDHHWFRFTGLSAEALKAELATGKGDGEMLAWDRPERSPQARSVGDSTVERLPQRTWTGWRRGDARVFHEASRRHK